MIKLIKQKSMLLAVIALIMSIAMVLASCGGSSSGNTTTAAVAAETTAAAATEAATTAAETTSAEGENMTLSVAVWDIAQGFPEDGSIDPMKQFFYDKFNVVIEPMGITWGDAAERYQVWSSSDSMPDISGGLDIVGQGRYFQWIEDGVVRALPDNLSAYPMVDKYIKLPETQAYGVDGKNYFLPRITYEDVAWWAMDRGVFFRKDWMENLGLDYPKSTDEFVDMCIAFTFNDPDGNGVNDTFGMTRSEITIYSQNFACFGYHERFWQKIDGIWTIPQATERVIPLVDMARRINKAGALDPDFITYTSTGPGDAVFSQGRAGVTLKQNTPGSVNTLRNLWMEYESEKEFLDCVEFLPMWDEPGMDTYRFSERAFWSETYIGFQVDDAKMARILEIADWLYSTDGVMFMQYGFEGEDYKRDSNGDIEILLPIQENGVITPLSTKYPFAFMASLIIWGGSQQQYVDPRTPKVVRDFCAEERDYRIANWKDPEVSWVVGGLNVPEKQETTYNLGDLWSIILMDTSDKTTQELYEEFLVPELEAGGFNRMIDAVNEATQALGL